MSEDRSLRGPQVHAQRYGMSAEWLRDGFEHTHPRTRIVVGTGAHRRLPELLADLAARSVFVVCGRTVGAGPQLAAVRTVLGDAVVGTFDGVRPQAGMTNLEQAARSVADSGADLVLSLGGGATIDSAKFLILSLSRNHPLADYRVPKGQGREAWPARRLGSTALRHVAIPTTAGSASEVMPWAGVRDEERAEKVLFRDPLLEPDVAVLDPLLVAATGPALTATSGVTAIARAVEAVYSRDRQPVAEAYALQALRLLANGVPRSIAAGDDLTARGQAQVGATLSGIAANNAMVSLVHALGHAMGGRYGLQHGVAHRILLPAAAGRLLPAAGDAARRLMESLDLPGEVGRWLAGMLDAMPIPASLREIGVARADLPALAEATTAEPMLAYCPRRVTTPEIEELLESCW